MQLAALFTVLLEERRRQPEDDLMSVLINARDDGRLLTEDEVVGTCILLLFAGHETTTHLIGNSVIALMRHRDVLEQLQYNAELIPAAVEELLRYDGPVTSLPPHRRG